MITHTRVLVNTYVRKTNILIVIWNGTANVSATKEKESPEKVPLVRVASEVPNEQAGSKKDNKN